MTIPNHAVMVTLAPEHWLRIVEALHTEAILLETSGDILEASRYEHTRKLLRHVTDPWEVLPSG
jgi:uncharacterized Fe-S cluster-containing radical SAM superfamily protein